jgi:hypothetical protein
MSLSSSRRRPRRPPRGRNRPPQHAATSALVSSILLVTTVWLIASATYYAVQFFEQMRIEQRASVADLSATGTIKQERITPPEATPAKMPTPASPTNDTVTFVAAPSPELRPSATTKRHQIHRAAHQGASRRHSVGAPPSAAAGIAPPRTTSSEQLSATTTPDAANDRAKRDGRRPHS